MSHLGGRVVSKQFHEQTVEELRKEISVLQAQLIRAERVVRAAYEEVGDLATAYVRYPTLVPALNLYESDKQRDGDDRVT